jgi:hypothetical protein
VHPIARVGIARPTRSILLSIIPSATAAKTKSISPTCQIPVRLSQPGKRYAHAVASEDAHWSVTNVAEGLAANDVQAKPDVAYSSGHSESYDGVNVKPSSIQPVTPPIIIFTGKPSRARRNAALLAPLQCGPAQ